MSTKTKNTRSVVDEAQAKLEGNMVYVTNHRYGGTFPLEERDENGKLNISDCDYDTHGRRINERAVRNLEFGEYKVDKLNLDMPADKEFYETRVKPWYELGTDPRIAKYGIKITEGGNFEGEPLPGWDTNKIDRCLGALEMLLGEDAESNRILLEKCARYELQRVYPPGHAKEGKRATRAGILKGIDELGHGVGDEPTDGEVFED